MGADHGYMSVRTPVVSSTAPENAGADKDVVPTRTHHLDEARPLRPLILVWICQAPVICHQNPRSAAASRPNAWMWLELGGDDGLPLHR